MIKFSDSIEGFKRHIAGVYTPSNLQEVIQLVREANEKMTPLYPISGGKNWGYGTALPVLDNNYIVDLSAMNKIITLDTHHGYAVIEPGVTQLQLYEALKNTPYCYDVTGSSNTTSVLGNILERGVAYQGQRTETLTAIEIVFGTGEVYQSGFWGLYPDFPTSHLYPHGLGAGLKDLFYQSAFGIVTKASIRLKKRPEYELSVSLSFEDSKLEAFIGQLKICKEQDLIYGIPHLASKNRFKSTAAPLLFKHLSSVDQSQLYTPIMDSQFIHDWYLSAKIEGTKKTVLAKKNDLKKRLKSYAPLYFLDKEESLLKKPYLPLLIGKEKWHLLNATKNLRALNFGVPTHDGVVGTTWGEKKDDRITDIASQTTGWIFYTPLAPLEGASARKYIDISNSTAKKFGFEAAVTLNTMSAHILEAVISIQFDKATESQQASQCIAEMKTRFLEEGFPPYRIGIQLMPDFVQKQNHWSIIKKLKSALDPHNIIAPNRYC